VAAFTAVTVACEIAAPLESFTRPCTFTDTTCAVTETEATNRATANRVVNPRARSLLLRGLQFDFIVVSLMMDSGGF
jgi:hypothetical protein